jgi:hypothetical protein
MSESDALIQKAKESLSIGLRLGAGIHLGG